jgi:hypothetical protein
MSNEFTVSQRNTNSFLNTHKLQNVQFHKKNLKELYELLFNHGYTRDQFTSNLNIKHLNYSGFIITKNHQNVSNFFFI